MRSSDWQAAEARSGALPSRRRPDARARAVAVRLSERRRGSSSSPTCGARMRRRSPRPIARCSWPRAAARSASSPRSRGCKRGASAHRRAARGSRPDPARAACRRDGRGDARRYLPRRGGCVPARHRRGARRRRRAGPLAAPHRLRPRAVAAPRYSAQGAQGGVRRHRYRRHDHAAAAAPGLRPAGAARRRHGVFVLLDRQMPSRLLGAFPEGVEIRRVGIKDAVAETAAFLGS